MLDGVCRQGLLGLEQRKIGLLLLVVRTWVAWAMEEYVKEKELTSCQLGVYMAVFCGACESAVASVSQDDVQLYCEIAMFVI